MLKYLFIISSIGVVAPAFANEPPPQVLPTVETPFFDDPLKIEAKPKPKKPEVAPAVDALPEKQTESVELNEDDLRQNPELAAQLIERAMRSQNWPLLADLLSLYRTIPEHDVILYDYASGALLRSQKKHAQAIAAYRRIISAHPELSYVRLDLAGMLYENKQYQAAKDQFERVKADNIDANARMLADAYLERIQKQAGWQFNAGVQYERNDNVNNASSVKYIEIGGRRFVRDEDSLPKRANGLQYNFSVERDWNLTGNHYATTEASVDGTWYWDNKDYSEESVRVSAGYKNQNIRRWASFKPFVGYNRLGGESYSRNFGATAEYGGWVNDNWQLIGSAVHMQRRYARDYHAKRYNGHLNSASFTAAWLPTAGLMIYGGVDYSREHTVEKIESSDRKGGRVGVIKEWNNGLSTRANLRYALRDFDEPSIRRDKEYQANVALWHRSVHLYGITPKLNFRYLKIDSNIPVFYSRQNRQWFITLEKTF
ncbi:MAG: surface lipoprotein assembly modifier [Neisseria animaloris]|uniref:surface lipoprotein assembly modifier n=1 Tax=Neisseria animaloris TaxID=326522 RepID=UPI000D31338A|nr:surface lipoprotein assembly modifier [Neisseria animaloris]MDO5074069.1 surface lipoprotein assembly modifier [Neisseria animaloris]